MIYRQHLLSALDARRDDFVDFERVWRGEVGRGARVLQRLGGRTSVEIGRELEASKGAAGALPSAELEQHAAFAVAFSGRWRSHEEARRWARATLAGRVTFAADGSQILPGREISLPVAGVQVAYFENPHAGEGGATAYRKDARFSVVTPGELLQADGGAGSPEAVVSFRRFELETETLCEFLERKRGWRERGERVPVAFFDGTLLISHARPRNRIQDEYVRVIIELVRLSRDTQVPVVGYIDQSFARDLVNMVDTLEGLTDRRSTVCDAQLLRAPTGLEESPTLLAAWGDRTIFCYCLREGLTEDFRDERGQPLVGFIYLQTTLDAAPARLDIPAWIYEAGLLDEVVDAVRAECVVGNGYPYPLETADAAAVLTLQDREQFLRTMQEFAEATGFAFRVSRKSVSKARRR
ncbi:MAG TPA: DNA double-strand break repair nuclease NurA [Pyrinomonadaceae bacterium]|jgi:hypothetical protein|nr:DNA double-strand break repair nuclease NurA [Pyrinomonadaceae bacterium]